MNISTVRDNIKKSIYNKEFNLEYTQALLNLTKNRRERTEHVATIKFLKTNIKELKLILADIETCCELEASV